MQQSQPFDQIATSYDDTFTNSPVGRLQRAQVYDFLAKILTGMSEKKVLELSCGTGEDAVWLARTGCQVTATDLSAGMIAVAEQKVHKAGLEKSVTVQQLSITEIDALPAGEKYDLIFSNFGGFNCLSPQAIAQVSPAIANRLRPGGHFVAVVMSDFCLWESLYFLAKFSFRKAFRRQSKKALSVSLGNGESVDTRYYSPRQFYHFFANHFFQVNCFPVGFAIPPSYLDAAFRQRPRLLQQLTRLEKRSQNFAVARRSADHFFMHLVRQTKL